MIVTWTVLRTQRQEPAAPWSPQDASWWQAGPTGAGRAEPPQGRWWSVLATWPDRATAEAGPPPADGVDAWHVVLEAAAARGDAVLAGGARPFEAVAAHGRVEGTAAVLTLAQLGQDGARERDFFRRFLHLGRGVGSATGHLVSMVQAPPDGAVLTFSVWEDVGAALDWAYAQPQHAGAVARQKAHRLVEASGFLRCAVLSSRGRLGDRPDPLAGRTGRVAAQEPVAG